MCNRFRLSRLLPIVLFLSSAYIAASVESPRSDCYLLDKDGYLYDFTDLKGKEFHSSDQDGSTYTIRLCKDVQVKIGQYTESLGRFSPAQSSAWDGSKSLLQEYRYGDLRGCENAGYDSSGRSSTVTIMCGRCPKEDPCQDPDGCICYVNSNQSNCLTSFLLGLNCKNRGPRVVSTFTVGFNPRGKEVVDNGITQWGYDNSYSDYSFSTQHSRVVLYLSAERTIASKIGKPEYSVVPEKGLKVQLSVTATNGAAPATVLSPSVLVVDWRCEKASMPYLVNVIIPVGEHDRVLFTLGKQCDFEDDVEKSGSSGWATFGVFIFVVIVMLTMFCCAGFLYKSRIEDRHGLDALPGFSAFASFIESTNDRYAPANDVTNITISHNGSSSGSGNQSARLPRSSDGPSYGAI